MCEKPRREKTEDDGTGYCCGAPRQPAPPSPLAHPWRGFGLDDGLPWMGWDDWVRTVPAVRAEPSLTDQSAARRYSASSSAHASSRPFTTL